MRGRAGPGGPAAAWYCAYISMIFVHICSCLKDFAILCLCNALHHLWYFRPGNPQHTSAALEAHTRKSQSKYRKLLVRKPKHSKREQERKNIRLLTSRNWRVQYKCNAHVYLLLYFDMVLQRCIVPWLDIFLQRKNKKQGHWSIAHRALCTSVHDVNWIWKRSVWEGDLKQKRPVTPNNSSTFLHNLPPPMTNYRTE